MKSKLSLLKHQKAFVLSKFKHTILVAGFGSGKTEAAVAKAAYKLTSTSSKLNVGYYLPNYPLINDIAVPSLPKMDFTKLPGYVSAERFSGFRREEELAIPENIILGEN